MTTAPTKTQAVNGTITAKSPLVLTFADRNDFFRVANTGHAPFRVLGGDGASIMPGTTSLVRNEDWVSSGETGSSLALYADTATTFAVSPS